VSLWQVALMRPSKPITDQIAKSSSKYRAFSIRSSTFCVLSRARAVPFYTLLQTAFLATLLGPEFAGLQRSPIKLDALEGSVRTSVQIIRLLRSFFSDRAPECSAVIAMEPEELSVIGSLKVLI
jgi:hypothetical protein